MPTRFFFEPSEFALPSLGELKGRWRFIPDPPIREMIAAEHQYLHFQEFLLRHLMFQTPRGHAGQFGLSARAGAVKAALLLYGSIIEAALQSHAHARGYVKPGKRLMFGQVLSAWEKAGIEEFSDVWSDIRLIKDRRNTIHLSAAAADRAAHHRAVLEQEHDLLSAGRRVLDRLELLGSPGADRPRTPAAEAISAEPSAGPALPPAADTSLEADEAWFDPAELEAWLNENVYSANPAEYRQVLLRWIDAAPRLDTAGWNRLHPRVELDRRAVERELREREAEEEYRDHLAMAEAMDRMPDFEEDPETSPEDEAEIDAFYSGGDAPEESDEDNPNWYELPEPDDYDGYEGYDDDE